MMSKSQAQEHEINEPQPIPPQRRWLSAALLEGILVLIACNFAMNYLRVAQVDLNLDRYILGEERLPFQYRALMVPIFRTLMSLYARADFGNIFSHLPHYISSPENLANFTVDAISFYLAVRIFAIIARHVHRDRPVYVLPSVVLFMVATYATFVLAPDFTFIFPYDVADLAFVQLCTLFIIRRNWVLLALIFPIATLNHERSAIVIVFLVIRRLLRIDDGNPPILMAGLLVGIWIAVKSALYIEVSGAGSRPFAHDVCDIGQI